MSNYYKHIENLNNESKEGLIEIIMNLEPEKNIDQNKLLGELMKKTREDLRDALVEILDEINNKEM